MTNLVGQSFDRYHILEQLGEGGMAIVYKAYDNHLDRAVAIKVILPGYEQSDKFIKRFEREAQSLARLAHPNIVRVMDYGSHNGLPYLVMEYLPGGTLKQKTGQPIPWREAARILAPIARALACAHQQGILHRDIKPSNILITHSGEPMLSDFGLAKLLEVQDGADLTGSGVIGTPAYMAPEQMTGGKVDQRADVYSLGVVFYELVTGRTPFKADTPAAVMIKAATEPLPRPTSFVADLPETVENAILKSLEKDPAYRFQSMEEFAALLERFAAERLEVERTISVAPIPPHLEAADSYLKTLQAKAEEKVEVQAKAEEKAEVEVKKEEEPAAVVEPAAALPAPLPQELPATPGKKRKGFFRPLAAILLVLIMLGGIAGDYFMGGFSGTKNKPIPSPTTRKQPPIVFPTPTLLPLFLAIQPYQFQEGDNFPDLSRFASGWQNATAPGERDWSLRLRANQPVTVSPSWCASPAFLNQNFPLVFFSTELDGKSVDISKYPMSDVPSADLVCRQFSGIIHDWTEGYHQIKLTRHLNTSLSNGKQNFLSGDYVDVFNINVLPSTPLDLSIVILPYMPQTGDNYPTIRSLTPGYRAQSNPGASLWYLSVPADQAALINQGWCSKTRKILDDNLQHIRYSIDLDGQPVDMGKIPFIDGQNAIGSCRRMQAIIQYWPEGVHIVSITMHLDTNLYDGTVSIAAGDYIDIYNVLVLPPTK